MSGELLSRRPIDSVTEREIDLLLLILLYASPTFRTFLVAKTVGVDCFEFLGAWRGVYSNSGECDLLVLLRDPESGIVAILIEDKIDASFQPNQAGRYRDRGEQGRDLKQWERFVTCLCAPKAYAETVGWDAILTYEAMEENLAARDEALSQFVRHALRQAVDKQRTGGFVVNPVATAFWTQYQRLPRDEFPNLRMTGFGEVQSINEPWPRFAAGALPARVKLEHKPRKGRVDLTFQDIKFDDLRARLNGFLPMNFEVCRTNPSAAVSLTVPSLDATKPFDTQVERARDAFRAAEAMLRLWPQIRVQTGFSPSEPDLT